MAQLRKRQDIWKLKKWDPTILWYARAIGELQSRPILDQTSWRYQAAIHEYRPGADDPNASPSDVFPPPAEQDKFWNQCQHNSWFFLPWHRMYLLFFEQIIGNTIIGLGGPPNWALPYWSYSDTKNPHATELPLAFREQKMEDDKPNPLFVKQRRHGNDGASVAGPRQVDIRSCLIKPVYQAQAHGGDPGFGGPKTQFNHDQGKVAGQLELVPHGSMHMAVGGFMGSFNTAGLDPIFWLHHCNIDRLWSVWRRRDPKHLNPKDAQWLSTIKFEFHDAMRQVVSMTVSQVVDTSAEPLLYEYEDISDPLGTAPRAQPEAVPESAGIQSMTTRAIPEMVGATSSPVTLSGRPTTTAFPVNPPTGPARESVGPGGTPRSVYLNFENITGSGQPVSYYVFVNVPPNSNPDEHDELYAGILPMFGVPEASRSDAEHGGSGLHYSLDVTGIVSTLQAKNEWDPKKVQVTFVPVEPQAEPSAAREAVAAPAASIQVGRVSLYHS